MPRPRQELIRMRISAGLSLRDQAALIGVSRNTLVNAEDGGALMISTARKIANHYDRPIPELFPDLLEPASS